MILKLYHLFKWRIVKKQELQQIVGKNIKRVRLSQKMTAQQLASKCNIEKSTMSRLEAGNTNPTIFTLYNISRALDVELKELIRI